MLRLGSLVLAVTLFFVPQRTGRGTTAPPGAEFPPQDVSLVFATNDGFYKAEARRLLREAPGTVEAIRALSLARDATGTLEAFRVIVDKYPERLADAVGAFQNAPLDARGDSELALKNQETLKQILADARQKLRALPREDAARVERTLIMLDGVVTRERRDWPLVLRQFIQQYRGTETAFLTEVDVITGARFGRQRFDELDTFIAQNPGTAVAAKALYTKGSDLHSINTLGNMFPHDGDPIERFRLVEGIVRELQSGRYPSSEWVDKAPSLIQGFFISERMKMAPESIDEMIAKLQQFAIAQAVRNEEWSPSNGLGYLVTSKIGDLYARKGERVAGVERTLNSLERSVAEPSGVRLLRGQFYLYAQRDESAADRTARLNKARQTLRAVVPTGTSINHRRALATLAALDFEDGQYRDARAAFQQYAKAYPSTSWTWVARIRIGQCEDALGNPAAAARAYLDAAKIHADIPLARVLGAAYAARAFELTGDLPKALEQHQRALAGWDNAYGLFYSSYVRRSANRDDPFVIPVDSGLVRKEALSTRIVEVTRAVGLPGGAMLERSRALVDRERYDEPAQELARMLAQHPKSPLAADARQLMHVAQLNAALQYADVQRPNPDEAKALLILDALAREPHDFGVTAGKIMRAVLLLKRGQAADAESTLRAALAEWHERQPMKSASNPLEEDVAAIRRTIFLPMGGEIYGAGRWNAQEWPKSPPPYLLVESGLLVKRHDSEVSTITLAEALPHAGKVLFFDAEQIALLQKMIVKLGGTKRREPRAVMETPNQPVGDSMQILALWNKFFPARPGHWGGWELEAYPVITEIHFTNADRTKASAKVTIGYSGATVELEKVDGKWITRRLTNQWIT